jgi:NarL family two-component system sensor histidine kinase YdfH
MYLLWEIALTDIVVSSNGKKTKAMYNKSTMQNKRNLLTLGKDLVIPPDKASWDDFKEVFPFFALMTMALGWMYVVFVKQVESPFMKVVFTILMFIHLAIYWGVFNFFGTKRGLWVYFSLQGLLAIILVLIAGDEGLVIGLFGSLIGNTVGVLQKPRTIFLVITIYLIVAVNGIIFLTGSEVLLSWASIAIPAILLSAFIAYMFRRQLEAREKTETLLKELQEAHKKLEAYTEQVEELTLSAERQRMARELHDTLAQGLAGLILKLEAVSTHVDGGNNPRAQEILQDAMAQSRTTLTEARQAIDDLRSDSEPGKSLDEAVCAEVRRFEAISEIPCEVVLQHNAPLPPSVREHILKIISEGLNNIAKHAGAGQAWLRLVETETDCKVEIEDDGRGFAVEDALNKEGSYGLMGIQERVALLHGTLTIDSAQGDGACLTVLIPLPEKAAEDA